MIDRENVIKELSELHGSKETMEIIEQAISMLKEQKAVPVIQREVLNMMLVWCCGSCGVAITDGDKFCRMCGKEMKWNETDYTV